MLNILCMSGVLSTKDTNMSDSHFLQGIRSPVEAFWGSRESRMLGRDSHRQKVLCVFCVMKTILAAAVYLKNKNKNKRSHGSNPWEGSLAMEHPQHCFWEQLKDPGPSVLCSCHPNVQLAESLSALPSCWQAGRTWSTGVLGLS